MKRALVLAALFALAFTVQASEQTGVGAQVKLEPIGPGQYLCSAEIQELPSGAVLVKPRIQMKTGKPAKITTALEDGRKVSMTVLIERGAAAWTVELKRGEALLGAQKGSVPVE